MDGRQIEVLKAALGAARPGSGFQGAWPQNQPVVDAFLAAASQWRTAVTSEERRLRTLWIGLDYAGAAIAWSARGIELTGELLSGVQAMELAARDALNGANA